MELMKNMPPLVKFEERTFEDRDATIKAGEFVGITKDIIKISPIGSKDEIERIYPEWLRATREAADQYRFPVPWIKHIEAQYAAWKNGTPAPSLGTSIKSWKHATPYLLKMMQAINISTIEELAEANEETLQRLGMGARKFQHKAKLFMEQKQIPEEIDEKDLSPLVQTAQSQMLSQVASSVQEESGKSGEFDLDKTLNDTLDNLADEEEVDATTGEITKPPKKK